MKYLFFTIFLAAQYTAPASQITYHGEKIDEISHNEMSMPYLEEPFINIEKYQQFIEKLDQQMYQAPINASLDEQGNIIEEKNGFTLNRQLFTEKFFRNYLNHNHIQIEVPLLPTYPKVDSELLATIKVKKIGQYITYFNSNNKERAYNIQLATKAINNQVVFPGERFSFNGVVGKRTKEKGYLPAPVIVRGELSEDIGGGICQVSSTLFNAVDQAGVKIGQRYSHSRNVPYVPPGRDATVSWYGPDFTFTNNHNQPILIRAKAHDGTLIILVYSSDVINYDPRMVPNAPKQLPEEEEIDSIHKKHS